MGRDRAAYMRDYRARKRAAHERYDEAKPLIGVLKTRVGELEAEVARLKRELAARPIDRYSTRPFTPVPKPSRRR